MEGPVRAAHTFGPVFDKDSRILILGTFPSVKSRETSFYYGHPQNRFWKVTAALVKEPVPETIGEKKTMLLRNRIAIWDVIAECDIKGSSDASIRNVVPSDIGRILKEADIAGIYANGAKAEELYIKYIRNSLGRDIVKLPSTSPANASFSLERLIEAWREAILPSGVLRTKEEVS